MLLRTVFSLLCLVVPALGWVPLTPGMTFQWQLQGTIDTTVNADVFDVDLFDASTSVINTLKSNGKVVICYFSAGSYENWRSNVSGVPSSALGNPLDGWAGEKWWDIRVTAVRDVIISRLNEAQNKGCDAVEPDNVDGYQNSNGLGLSQADQLDFNKWMAVEARKRCLSVGLKNAVDLLNDLEPYFDWALNEECLDYNECSGPGNYGTCVAGRVIIHIMTCHTNGSTPKVAPVMWVNLGCVATASPLGP
nr:hypothetical protein BaRGS_018490 [Batillaria attramentaria]